MDLMVSSLVNFHTQDFQDDESVQKRLSILVNEELQIRHLEDEEHENTWSDCG